MATPLKPWERGAVSAAATRAAALQTPQFSFTSRASNYSTNSTSANTSTTTTANSVPSVPPRTTTTGGYLSSQAYVPGFAGGLGGYGGGYSGGYGSYGYGYRPFGGVGGIYGGGYGHYGNVDSQFVRQAEESTRAAFQSVESVVGTVSSISAMLESTYFAVHSCFRAVLGVAQQFTRLRNHVWGIISAVTLLHHLKYWVKKLLRLILWRRNREQDEVWEEVQDRSLWHVNSRLPSENRVWPAFVFLAIILGVPWLLWKLLAAKEEASAVDSWSEGSGQQLVTARALYDFTPQREDELGFSAGDEMVLAPRQLQSGWVLAGKDRRSGLVPVNYIQIQLLPSVTSSGKTSGTPPISSNTTPPSNTLPAASQQLHAEEILLND